MSRSCPFCDISSGAVLDSDELCVAIRDRYPVARGHTLLIPKRHVESYFDLAGEELLSLQRLLERAKNVLDDEVHPDGYNIGANVGEAAGQTVWHVHLHLIPRFAGDMEDPRGGIRHCIPRMGHYEVEAQKGETS